MSVDRLLCELQVAIQFQPHEIKNRRARTIRVNRETATEVAELIDKRPKTGFVFLSPMGKRWDVNKLSLQFRQARERAEKKGMTFDPETCLYACRHTYAKRMLEGDFFEDQRKVTVQTLAKFMGNTPKVCQD